MGVVVKAIGVWEGVEANPFVPQDAFIAKLLGLKHDSVAGAADATHLAWHVVLLSLFLFSCQDDCVGDWVWLCHSVKCDIQSPLPWLAWLEPSRRPYILHISPQVCSRVVPYSMACSYVSCKCSGVIKIAVETH